MVRFCKTCNRNVKVSHKCYKEVDLTHLVSQPNDDENRHRLLYQWTVTEDIQDHSPYLEWGWWGFIPMIIQRDLY